MSQDRPSVLVVDDEAPVVELIQEYLEGEGFEVVGAASAKEATDQIEKREFSALVVDVVMPEVSGYDLVSDLRDRRIDTPVLMLTGQGRVEDVVQGLEVGADDYLTKPFHLVELEARIRALIRRMKSAEGSPIEIADLVIDPLARIAKRGGEPMDLTHREFDILYYMARRSPEVVTREELLKDVWRVEFDPGTNVVEVHVFNLRKKMEDSGGRRLVHTVRGQGYKLEA
jgi:DNA-binding response OmpR family regulator